MLALISHLDHIYEPFLPFWVWVSHFVTRCTDRMGKKGIIKGIYRGYMFPPLGTGSQLRSTSMFDGQQELLA